jgi:hypothetical protein
MQAANAGAATSTPPAASSNEAPASTEAELRLQRAMKFVVAGLALLLIAGLVAVAMRVIYLASKPKIQEPPQAATRAPPAVASTRGLSAELRLALPAGAEVRSVSLSGDRLAVHYIAGATAGIAILDLQTGRKLSDVTIAPGQKAD